MDVFQIWSSILQRAFSLTCSLSLCLSLGLSLVYLSSTSNNVLFTGSEGEVGEGGDVNKKMGARLQDGILKSTTLPSSRQCRDEVSRKR